jgi:hypothetical protein
VRCRALDRVAEDGPPRHGAGLSDHDPSGGIGHRGNSLVSLSASGFEVIFPPKESLQHGGVTRILELDVQIGAAKVKEGPEIGLAGVLGELLSGFVGAG